jgi:hypothetical protein
MGLEKALVHDELMRLDQVRHAFISIASHELRTPATAVLGAALTLVAREHQLSDEQQRELKLVLAEQAQRLATLIEAAARPFPDRGPGPRDPAGDRARRRPARAASADGRGGASRTSSRSSSTPSSRRWSTPTSSTAWCRTWS